MLHKTQSRKKITIILVLLLSFSFTLIMADPTNPEQDIKCYSNSDCGTDQCAGDPNYCENNDVYQVFIFFTCNNPGQTDAFCSDFLEPVLIQDCGDDYCEDYTDNFCKDNNLYKKRTCYNQGCSEIECSSTPSTEKELVEECKYGCKNKECKPKPRKRNRENRECIPPDYCGEFPEDNPSTYTELEYKDTTYTQTNQPTQPITLTNSESQITKNKPILKNIWLIVLTILILTTLIFIIVAVIFR